MFAGGGDCLELRAIARARASAAWAGPGVVGRAVLSWPRAALASELAGRRAIEGLPSGELLSTTGAASRRGRLLLANQRCLLDCLPLCGAWRCGPRRLGLRRRVSPGVILALAGSLWPRVLCAASVCARHRLRCRGSSLPSRSTPDSPGRTARWPLRSRAGRRTRTPPQADPGRRSGARLRRNHPTPPTRPCARPASGPARRSCADNAWPPAVWCGRAAP